MRTQEKKVTIQKKLGKIRRKRDRYSGDTATKHLGPKREESPWELSQRTVFANPCWDFIIVRGGFSRKCFFSPLTPRSNLCTSRGNRLRQVRSECDSLFIAILYLRRRRVWIGKLWHQWAKKTGRDAFSRGVLGCQSGLTDRSSHATI